MNYTPKLGSARGVTEEASLPPPKPKVLAAWLDELPLANHQYCYDALEAVLEAFNADARIPGATRYELADRLRPTVRVLTTQAESHFLDAPLPYPPKADYHAGMAFRLDYQLGMAYALAGFDPNWSVGWFRSGEKQLGRALYRAFQHWGWVLLRTAQRYQTPAAEYWSTLYRLYRVAEVRKLLEFRCDDPDEPEPCKTALGIFKRSLLFEVAGMQHLRQRDMGQVYELLGSLADHATYSREPTDQGWQSAGFLVTLDADLPPTRLGSGMEFKAHEGRGFLATLELGRTLEKMVGQADPSGKRPLDESVLINVARNLEGPRKRKTERRAREGHCPCVVGLHHLIAVLTQADADQNVLQETRNDYGLLPQRRQEFVIQDADFSERNLRSEVGLDGQFKRTLKREDIWDQTAPETPPREVSEFLVEGRIANAGLNGYCIIWPSDKLAGIKVGELIGIDDDRRGAWFVGVIRWLHCGEGRVKFGVELVTLAAEVADLLDVNMKPTGKALCLPPERGLRDAPELLTHPGRLQAGTMARITDADGNRFYKTQTTLKGNASFSRYGLVSVKTA